MKRIKTFENYNELTFYLYSQKNKGDNLEYEAASNSVGKIFDLVHEKFRPTILSFYLNRDSGNELANYIQEQYSNEFIRLSKLENFEGDSLITRAPVDDDSLSNILILMEQGVNVILIDVIEDGMPEYDENLRNRLNFCVISDENFNE